MLRWSDSPLTNCRSGEPRPGTAVALNELVRSKLYSVGLKSTLMTLPLSAPSRTVMVAFLSWALLIVASDSAPLALDAHALLHAANHVVCQSIQQFWIDMRNFQHRRPLAAGLFGKRCLLARNGSARLSVK